VASAVLASVDGRITPPGEATISILDDGLLRGDGAFEVIKLYGGVPFRLDEHYARLGRSADAIHLEFDLDSLRAEVDAILAEDADPDGCVRIVVTRGGRRLLTVEGQPDWAPSARIALVTLTPHELLAGVKSISYAGNMQATRIAAKQGADEAVYVTPDGIVLEAPTSSIFWTDRDGTLKTPSLDVGILDSITRDVVIAGTAVTEGALGRDDLLAAEEAFLASTTREIQPIAAIDDAELPIVDGPGAERAKAALREAVEAERSRSVG
jgi:branched-chain amino acid aminotransferase